MVTTGSRRVMWTSQLPGCISDPTHSATLTPSSSSETLTSAVLYVSLSPGTIRRTGGVSFCLALFWGLSWGASRAGLPLGKGDPSEPPDLKEAGHGWRPNRF